MLFPIRDHNPSGRMPFVTYALLIINIVVFFSTWHLEANPRALYALYADYALVPAMISQGDGFGGFFTSMFLHGGLMHLAGNMLFLFIFGDNIEDEMGHLPYLAFYLACGFAAGLAQYLADPVSRIPMIGASGAIAGVMGGYLLMFPKARVDVFIFLLIIIRVLPVPSSIVLAAWFGMQVFGGFATPSDAGGVAYWAHAGGFVAGVALIAPLWLKRGGQRFWDQTLGHPPHPEARYGASHIPRVPRRRRKPGPWGR